MIEVNNRTKTLVNEALVKQVAREVLAKEGKTGKALSVALVGAKTAEEINKKYRKKDTVANVLSFAAEGSVLGEVILCPQQVRKDAKKYGMMFEKALCWMLIHGILHLAGYDHMNEAEARVMEQREAEYLSVYSFSS